MKYAIPRKWREPMNHSINCYFRIADPSKRKAGKNAITVYYPDLSSPFVSVPHCTDLLVTTPPKRAHLSIFQGI